MFLHLHKPNRLHIDDVLDWWGKDCAILKKIKTNISLFIYKPVWLHPVATYEEEIL